MPRRFDRLKIEPARIQAMHTAYECVRVELGLADIPDKINNVLVMKIVELGLTESDPDKLCAAVSAYFRGAGPHH
jgi:hypothetical protein